ncbi:MAG: radical SAM protein [Candidatus Bathyarchaeia archaeon]
MVLSRKVPFLTCEVTPRQKVKINLSGCNFNCRGCFAVAKKECGRNFTVDKLLELLVKSCHRVYGGLVDDVQMTGGEPLKNPKYLFALIQGLKTLGVSKVGISTNGYMLSEDVIERLKALDVNYIKLDLKAYSKGVHKWYTGKSNTRVLKAVKLLHKYGLNFYVRTIVIPNIVDAAEVEKIAKFLSSVDINILYRLYEFAPEQLENKISRKPAEEEMVKAYVAARKHLKNVEFFIYKPSKPSTYKTAYDPNYRVVEIRADELLETFMKIDKIAKSVDPEWNIQFFTMNQILKGAA